jgi:hypothetical protein
MRRDWFPVSVAAAALAAGSIPLASASTPVWLRGARSKTHIEIRERGSMTTFRGTFVLELNYLNVFDRGTTQLGPVAGHTPNNVSGQEQRPIHGTDMFTGKKGTLSIKWRSVEIEIDRTSPIEVTIQYGTWQVTSGTGAYKNWKGGGRFAAVLAKQFQGVWDGYVAR